MPHAFGPWDREENALRVKLDKMQVEHSPLIEFRKPGSPSSFTARDI
ncbi:MAG: hypothetical protein Q8M02_09025 [Candidatus Didemnitutus sp.]|nr:hypothetical protein [Candidatus Didemnitutus sp.]